MTRKTKITLAAVLSLLTPTAFTAALAAPKPKPAAAGEITQEQAVQVALKQFPGARLEKVELEEEAGLRVYSVELKTPAGEREVLVNAATSAVVKIETAEDEEGSEHEGADADD